MINKIKKTKRVKNNKYNSKKYKNYKKTKKAQFGGLKLGEGGFGCVIGPYIMCNNKKSSNKHYKVSKIIQSETEDYKEEYMLYRKIKNIDPKQKYLLSFVDSCILKENNINNREDVIIVNYKDKKKTSSSNDFNIIDSDKNIKDDELDNYCKFDPRLKYFNQIQIYGGKELSTYFKISETDTRYKTIKSNFRFIFKHLLEGLKLLHKNKVVHRDIKPQNILLDLSSIKLHILPPRYIDFGLSTDMNLTYTIEDIGHRQGTAKYIPIDIYIAYKIVKLLYKNIDVFSKYGKNILLTDVITMYNTKYKQEYKKDKLDKSFLKFKSNTGDLVDSTKYLNNNDIILLVNKLLKQYSKDTLLSNNSKIYDGYLYKADVFALGLTMRKMYNAFQINNNKFENLLKYMLHPNPDKRYNVNQCLKHIALKKKVKTKT